MRHQDVDETSLRDVVHAIDDLTRVMFSTQSEFRSRSEAVRHLKELGVTPSRIASILSMRTSDVSSVLAKSAKTARATPHAESGHPHDD